MGYIGRGALKASADGSGREFWGRVDPTLPHPSHNAPATLSIYELLLAMRRQTNYDTDKLLWYSRKIIGYIIDGISKVGHHCPYTVPAMIRTDKAHIVVSPRPIITCILGYKGGPHTGSPKEIIFETAFWIPPIPAIIRHRNRHDSPEPGDLLRSDRHEKYCIRCNTDDDNILRPKRCDRWVVMHLHIPLDAHNLFQGAGQ